MRIFRARIDEVGGAHLEPEYLASDDFEKYVNPVDYLKWFWGLENDDVVSYELIEMIDGEENVLCSKE